VLYLHVLLILVHTVFLAVATFILLLTGAATFPLAF